MPIDPQVKDLVSAIGQAETGPTNASAYTKSGASGEYGRYQFLPATWDSYSKEAGVTTPLAQASIEDQNKVAYTKIKQWKDAGYNPAQIASMWNAGPGKPDAYKENFRGVNAEGVAYDTPAYAAKVSKYYQQNKAQTSSSSDYPTQPLQIPDGISTTNGPESPTGSDNQGFIGGTVSDISKRVTEGTNAAASGVNAALHGDVGGAVSGLIQTAGAAGGAVGDVTNRALELVPGVKQLEGLLGQGVGYLASTPTGQTVAKAIQDWSDKNPELAKDVGAGFNIATAIPIFRGLGVLKSVAGDAASQALKGIAEKSFIEGAPELMGTSKSAIRFVENNPTVFKDMTDRRLVGDIVDGRYTTKTSAADSWKTIEQMNKQVNTILDRPEYSAVAQDGENIAKKAILGYTDRTGKVVEGIPNSGMTPAELIANAKKLDSNNSLLWDKFAAGQANLKEINELRSSLDSKVKKAFIGKTSIDSPELASSKENGALLSSAMRDTVQTTAPSTMVPFGEMAKQFNIQKALEFMDGKKVKPGMVATLTGHAVGAGTGGVIGGLVGGPTGVLVGGYIGDNAAGKVAQKLASKNVIQGILKKTGAKATRTGTKKILKGSAGLIGGAQTQKVGN